MITIFSSIRDVDFTNKRLSEKKCQAEKAHKMVVMIHNSNPSN